MRHFAANYIFDGQKLIKNSLVSVNDFGQIAYVGKENEGLTERASMIFYNGIISPGFVNAHCHLELSDFAKLDVQGKGMLHFIKSVINNRSDYCDLKKIELADIKMFEKGINLVGDIVNTDKTVEIKSNSHICYHNFVEVSGIKKSDAVIKMQYAENLLKKFQQRDLSASIVPHSFYSISETILHSVLSNSSNEILSIHFLESLLEYEMFSGKRNLLYDFLIEIDPDYAPLATNCSEIYSLAEKLTKSKSIILVHNIEAENNEMPVANNCFLCICPGSNLFLHNKLPSEELVYKNQNRIVVGTDSLASNTDLDVLGELKIMASKYSDLSLASLLKMATKNGATALFNDNFGRLELGSIPGLILIENLDLINLKIMDNSRVLRIM